MAQPPADRCGHCSGLLRIDRGESGNYWVCFNCGREYPMPARPRYGKLGGPNHPDVRPYVRW